MALRSSRRRLEGRTTGRKKERLRRLADGVIAEVCVNMSARALALEALGEGFRAAAAHTPLGIRSVTPQFDKVPLRRAN